MTAIDDPDVEPYLDVMDLDPGCPRCAYAGFECSAELHAWVCDNCGLWIDL